MCLRPIPQLYRAVDTGSGVPPGIGLIRVSRDYFQGVLSRVNQAVQLHIEICVAVGTEHGFFPVDENLGLAVDPLKLQDVVPLQLRF